MKSAAPFLLVGTIAAAVHQLVVIVLVETGILGPAYGNVPAFILAWFVSYFGHRVFTFRSDRPHMEAAPRFLVVSLCAFLSNQLIFVVLLEFTSIHYAAALFLTLLLVAAGTYLFSARWAFHDAACQE